MKLQLLNAYLLLTMKILMFTKYFIELPKPEDQEIDIERLAYSDYYL